MKKVAEEKQVVVAQAKADCEELLVEIVQDKRVADEQEKTVNAEATKISRETEEANAIATQVSALAWPAVSVIAYVIGTNSNGRCVEVYNACCSTCSASVCF